MKVFIVAEQVGELWRIKDTTLIALTETSKGKTFEEDRDLHHNHVFVNYKAPGFAGGSLLKSSLSSS